jgi:hypothetical protein
MLILKKEKGKSKKVNGIVRLGASPLERAEA